MFTNSDVVDFDKLYQIISDDIEFRRTALWSAHIVRSV